MKRMFIVRILLLLTLLSTSLAAQPATSIPDVLEGRTDTLLHDYLMQRAAAQFAARRSDVASSLASKAEVQARRERLKDSYRDLLGDLPLEKTPLRAETVSTRSYEGYRVENVFYESRPNHRVTANLYVPEGNGPWPGILFVCGHSDIGKAADAYQSSAILLAKNGFVTLVVDPIGQGERYQILNEDGTPATRGGTVEHSFLFVLAQLTGTSVVALEAWDNMRGIDYLVSRPEVNPAQIGLTGNSGGGTQTTFLMSLDDRIDVAAPSCFIMTRERLFETIGPQDGCQHLPGEGRQELDHADYVTMFSPKPVILLAAEQDFFEFAATQEAYAETEAVYSALGIPERTRFFSFDDTHGYSRPRREAMVQWMRRWFYDDDRRIVEPEMPLAPEEDLRVTENGQVGAAFTDEISVQQILSDRGREFLDRRERFFEEVSHDMVKTWIAEMIGYRDNAPAASVETKQVIGRDGYSIRTLLIQRPGDVPIPGLLFIPDSIEASAPVVISVDGRGKTAEAGENGAIPELIEQGRIVLSLDLRGYGETADDPEKNTYIAGTQREYRTAMIALHIGRPLLGQRVEDVVAGIAALGQIAATREKDIELHAFGAAGPVAFHAAALDDRISYTRIEGSIPSWMTLFETPTARHQLGNIVPRALKWYDLPDLIRLAGERTVDVIAPTDGLGRLLVGVEMN